MKLKRRLSPGAIHPREPVPCFLFGSVTYLPDYKKPDIWHAPGGRVFKKKDLISNFPLFRSLLLWDRPYVVSVRP